MRCCLRQHITWTSNAYSALNILTRLVYAAEPANLSALWYLFYVKSAGGLMKLAEIENGAQMWLIEGGSMLLPMKLAGSLKRDPKLSSFAQLHLNERARAIEQHGDYVSVATDKGTYTAQYCIVTLPPALAGRLQYTPPLPAEKDLLFQVRCLLCCTSCCVHVF
jgi:monoamine oxidase